MDAGNVIPLRGRDNQPGTPLIDMWESWLLALEAADLSTETIRSYHRTINDAARWFTGHGMPGTVEHTEPEHIRAFLVAVKERASAGTAAKDYRNLRVFWNWLVAEGERTSPNPMLRVAKVEVDKKVFPVFDDDELRALVKACSARDDFEHRRDLAIIRVFMDNGVRVSGLAGVQYRPDDQDANDVNLTGKRKWLRVRLKGGDMAYAPIGKKAAVAIDRYLRKRKQHKRADSPYLWLPVSSRTTRTGDCRFTATGIKQMVERRGEQAGLARHAHPHKFRRTMATSWEGDIVTLKNVGGWKTLGMAEHYQKAREVERALDVHAQLAPGDRI